MKSSVCGIVDKSLKKLLFEKFGQQIAKSSLGVKTCIKTHCSQHCFFCSSFQVMCTTLLHCERAKLEIMQSFCWETFFWGAFGQIFLEHSKYAAKKWLQLTLHFPSPNQHWDAIHRIIGQRSATKFYMLTEKIMGSQLFSPKTVRRRSLVRRNFRHVQLRPC